MIGSVNIDFAVGKIWGKQRAPTNMKSTINVSESRGSTVDLCSISDHVDETDYSSYSTEEKLPRYHLPLDFLLISLKATDPFSATFVSDSYLTVLFQKVVRTVLNAVSTGSDARLLKKSFLGLLGSREITRAIDLSEKRSSQLGACITFHRNTARRGRLYSSALSSGSSSPSFA